MGVALGDYEHKGLFSIAITHFSEEYAALYRNDGGLNFTDVSYPSGIARGTTPYVGWGDAFFDLDNDGWPDLIMVNGHVYPQVDTKDIGTKFREPKLLYLNQHDGTFRDISKLAGAAIQIPQVSRGLAVGDLFNDGRLDIVVENLEGEPMILRNQGRVPATIGSASNSRVQRATGSRSTRACAPRPAILSSRTRSGAEEAIFPKAI